MQINLKAKPDREQAADAATLESMHKRDRERERFLDHLARKHAERLNLPLPVARQRVDRVAATSRKRDENMGNFAWRAYG